MTEYAPPFAKQLDGTPFAGNNCAVVSSTRAALDRHAGERPPGVVLSWPPVPHEWRVLTGRTKPTDKGTNLGDNARVAAEHYRTDLVLFYDDPFDDVWAEFEAAGGMVLQGAEGGWALRYRGSRTFTGNHGVYVYDPSPTEATVLNSLRDGRPGSPGGPGAMRVPRSELRAFAGALRFYREDGTYRALGEGRAYAGIVQAREPAPVVRLPVVLGGNAMIIASLGLTTSRRMSLAEGTPVYREPGGPRITSMRKDAAPPYIGMAGTVDGVSYRAVIVSTRNFADRQPRRVVAYVRADAGDVL